MMPIQGTDPKKAMEMAAEFDKRQMEAAKIEAEKRAMAATAAQGPVQRQASQAKPAPKAVAKPVPKAVATPAPKAVATRPAPAPKAVATPAPAPKAVATPAPAPTPVKPALYDQYKAMVAPGIKPGTTDVRPPMPSGQIQTQTLAPGATGPMTPVRGGGMAPASIATRMKKGGRVKAKAKSSYSSGGKVSSASKRGDGCAQRGKTKGRMI